MAPEAIEEWMPQAIWVALCPRFHSCFLIPGVINTEKRMKRDAPQPLSQGRGSSCQHFLPLKFLSYFFFSLFFFLAIADPMKQRWQSRDSWGFVLWPPSTNIPAGLTELLSWWKEGMFSRVQGVLKPLFILFLGGRGGGVSGKGRLLSTFCIKISSECF